MIRVTPVLHLYDEEIESQVLFSPSATVVKFHAGCDVEELHKLVRSRLNDSEHEVFMDLFANDSAKRKFESKKGFLVIS